MAANDISLILGIKDRIDPLTIHVPPTLTPNEIIRDLQEQKVLPDLANRTPTMTFGKMNLRPDTPIGEQGVVDGSTCMVVWDGQLARRAS